MNPDQRQVLPYVARYGGAAASVAVAAALTRALATVGDAGISPLFFAAVLISAWFGGLGPGLLATVLSGAATALLLLPRVGSLLDVRDAVLRVLVFTVVALLGSSLNAALKRAAEASRQAAEAFRRARDAAEDASAAKSRFLAMVSHELRTPLNPVLLAAERLEDDPALPERARRDLRMIRRQVELEVRLIDDLVDLTLLSSGKLALQPTLINLHDALRAALATCEPATREKRLDVRTDLAAAESHVLADPMRLEQIFWNLIRNATKFTPPGGRLTVRTANDREGGGGSSSIVVEVADTGIGIDPDRLGDIFQAFEQGGPDIAARFGGLGLGLAICQALTQAQGGALRADSPGPDQGATFTIAFPTQPAPVMSNATP